MFVPQLRHIAVPVLLAALLAAPAGAQAPAPWSAGHRTLALQALRQGGESVSPASSDAALEAAVVRFAARELGQRVSPSQVERIWAIAPPHHDVPSELTAARSRGALGAWLADLPPPEPEYRNLEVAAARYRGLAVGGGWAALPKGSVLRRGDRDAQVPLLRARLAAEGYGRDQAEEKDLFDAPLQAALIAFQSHHAVFNDGVLNPETRAALNVPVQARQAQIEANLERWRWLPHALPSDRFELDIAGAAGRLIRADRAVLQMKVIVGQPSKQTPSFASKLESVVLNPPWNVPASIAEAEILPKAARQPGYLARNHYAYVDGHLQQAPGPDNALGQVKFDLPSPFGVYLHDTPAKAAFNRRVRTLSHGCMRLEKPRDLAGALLESQGWTTESIAEAIATGETKTVRLKAPLPLFVLYWTAVADPKGQVDFRPDVYGWDAKLIEALGGLEAAIAAAGPADQDCQAAAP